AWALVMYLRTLQPDDTIEKQIARQLGLTPINPLEPLPDSGTPANAPSQPAAPSNPPSNPPQSNNSGNQ
ncbi:MAG: hypothetical protein WB555_02955, partial [Candidatus Korobacteraceae bacterium]